MQMAFPDKPLLFFQRPDEIKNNCCFFFRHKGVLNKRSKMIRLTLSFAKAIYPVLYENILTMKKDVRHIIAKRKKEIDKCIRHIKKMATSLDTTAIIAQNKVLIKTFSDDRHARYILDI